MRFVGLTLALLASSLGARAESVEDRVNALEARVKALEEALRVQGSKQAAATSIDGEYHATLPGGDPVTLTFDKGKVIAVSGNGTKTATYEVVGQRVVVTAGDGGKTEVLTIDGNVLHGNAGKDKTIDFTKTK